MVQDNSEAKVGGSMDISGIMTAITSQAEAHATSADGHFDIQAYISFMAGMNAGMRLQQLIASADATASKAAEVGND